MFGVKISRHLENICMVYSVRKIFFILILCNIFSLKAEVISESTLTYAFIKNVLHKDSEIDMYKSNNDFVITFIQKNKSFSSYFIYFIDGVQQQYKQYPLKLVKLENKIKYKEHYLKYLVHKKNNF